MKKMVIRGEGGRGTRDKGHIAPLLPLPHLYLPTLVCTPMLTSYLVVAVAIAAARMPSLAPWFMCARPHSVVPCVRLLSSASIWPRSHLFTHGWSFACGFGCPHSLLPVSITISILVFKYLLTYNV
jgi:hypothetical protein